MSPDEPTITSRKVGVFMPCYNMGRYLEDSLASLAVQTFSDFEVVIADDASTDPETHRELARLKGTPPPRTRIVFEPANLGLIAIANKHMAELDAEYIMLFSPDDRMAPEFLEEQVRYLDQHPTTAAVCTWIQSFGESDAVLSYSDEDCALPRMLVENRFSGAALVRKSAWLEAGMHDSNPDLFPNLDYDLWLSMLSKGMTLGTIARPLFFWRVVGTSLSHDVSAERVRVFRRALLNKYSEQYAEHSSYVIGHQIDELARFEDYYHQAEEGHTWLDAQYHALTAEVKQLTAENQRFQGDADRRASGLVPTIARRGKNFARALLRRG